MIARVTPVRRFPRGQGIYDYTIPEDLTISVGSFVLVPFRSQTVLALIIEIVETSPFNRLKQIIKISEYKPLSKNDVEFYLDLSKYTYESVGSILNASIPQRPRKKTSSKPKAIEPLHVKAKTKDISDLQRAIKHISSNQLSTISIPATNFAYLIAGILTHHTKEPILFICPSIETMGHVARIAAAYSPSVHVYGGNMSKTQAFNGAMAIREGSCSVVVATRVGALIPPSANTRIVVIESGSEDLHQVEQRPHYDARWCIKNRLRTHKNPVTFLDVLPRAEESPITLDLWRKPSLTKVIPFSDPRETRRPWFLTNTLISTIEKSDPNQLFIIYHNRLEFERMLLCGECGGTASKGQTTCDSCGSTKIRTKGLGMKKVQEGLASCIADRPVLLLQSKHELPTSGVVIATRTILSRWPHGTAIGGVGVILTEQLFAHHDFRSLEKGRRTIRTLSSNAEAQRIPCIIQCIDPEMVHLALGPTSKLIDEEIESRKLFNYPPFGSLIDIQKSNSIHSKQYKLALNEYKDELLTLPMNYDIIVN